MENIRLFCFQVMLFLILTIIGIHFINDAVFYITTEQQEQTEKESVVQKHRKYLPDVIGFIEEILNKNFSVR